MENLSATSMVCLALWIVGLVSLVIWGQTFRHKERNMMGSMNLMFTISGVFLVVATGSLFIRGLNYGLDFTGGTMLEIGSYKMLSGTEVQSAIADFKTPDLGDKVVQVGDTFITSSTGKPYQKVLVRVTRAQPAADGGKELRDNEPVDLYKHISDKFGGEMEKLSTSSIGPTITGELKSNAIWAVAIALVLQCGYIWLRFGNQLRFGVAADLAIVHDVVIMVGLYSLSGRQLDSPFVAALLTVAGYSVMDSVVIFDRIRENLGLNPNKKFELVVNESINQTMTRSINTTLTVVITLLSIYFFGGTTLQNFAFALLIGIISGAYSSICIASPILILIDRWVVEKEKAAALAAGSSGGKDHSQGAAEVAVSTGTDGVRRRRRGVRSKRD